MVLTILTRVTPPIGFFKLLNYSDKLKRNNKFVGKDDPEAFATLLKFLSKIVNNFQFRNTRFGFNLIRLRGS